MHRWGLFSTLEWRGGVSDIDLLVSFFSSVKFCLVVLKIFLKFLSFKLLGQFLLLVHLFNFFKNPLFFLVFFLGSFFLFFSHFFFAFLDLLLKYRFLFKLFLKFDLGRTCWCRCLSRQLLLFVRTLNFKFCFYFLVVSYYELKDFGFI